MQGERPARGSDAASQTCSLHLGHRDSPSPGQDTSNRDVIIPVTRREDKPGQNWPGAGVAGSSNTHQESQDGMETGEGLQTPQSRRAELRPKTTIRGTR